MVIRVHAADPHLMLGTAMRAEGINDYVTPLSCSWNKVLVPLFMDGTWAGSAREQ